MVLPEEKKNPKDMVNFLKSKSKVANDLFFIMLGEELDWDIDLFIDLCNKEEITIIGGIFPAVIKGNNLSKDDIIVKKMSATSSTTLVKNISYSPEVFYPIIDKVDMDNKQTAIVLIDGLAKGVDNYLSDLYKQVGDTVNYIGGGAGTMNLKQNPCVFCNEGLFMDAAIVCFVDSKVKLGVKHGWRNLMGPLIATKTNFNTLEELNWSSPFDLYATIIREDSGQDINRDNFLEISKVYPFGIAKENDEYVVRDPINLNEKGEITFFGEVHENVILDVLKGSKEDIIEAAQEAAKEACNNIDDVNDNLMFDCISRPLFLKDDNSKTLDLIIDTLKNGGNKKNLEGALSLGEISSHRQSYLEFFNRTILLGVFYD